MGNYKIMIKNFEVNDILNAVESISKLERKKGQKIEKEIPQTNNNGVLTVNKPTKSNKSEILVLEQMIE